MHLVGINGGTFDPIHFGHLRAALEVEYKLGLNEVRFIPCYQPVHKNRAMVSAEQRCQMVALAIEDQASFTLDKIEVERGGPSYMVDTLTHFKQQQPKATLVLMMGTDAFSRFHTWRNWQKILTLANIAVMHRPGEHLVNDSQPSKLLKAHQVSTFTQSSNQIAEVLITQLDLSSTAVRSHLQHNRPVDYLLPPQVINYIKTHRLYQ